MGPSPIRVVRHESDLGRWEAVSRDPAPSLRSYVGAYKGYVQGWATPSRRRAVVGPDVAMIVHFGSPLGLTDPRDRPGTVEYRNAFVAGLHDSYSLYEWTGDAYGIQVDLSPIGANLILGLPMEELTNRVVDLEDVLGEWGRRLAERLHDAPGWEARFSLLDSALASRLAEAAEVPPGVVRACRELEASGGRVAIATLAEDVGYRHEHLTRQFRRQVGLPPKTLARILRFTNVMGRLERGLGSPWADIAVDCGYFDQAHLIRDFRRFAGATPRNFLTLRLPEGGGVAA
jgi:AraC-like DNA-binding protein